jgi:hypothetical protein
MVVGHYQPLADDGTLTFQLNARCAPSDQTCLLQSIQKTKTSKLICGQRAGFQATGDSLVFGLWEKLELPKLGTALAVSRRRVTRNAIT